MKADSKYNLIMLFFERSIHKIIIKSITVYIKILSSSIVFNIDNNKKLFLSKSAY